MKIRTTLFILLFFMTYLPLHAEFDEGFLFQKIEIAGTYTNVQNSNLSKLIIRCKEGKYFADVYVKCGRKQCQWKPQEIKKQKDGTYLLTYRKSFSTKKLVLKRKGNQIDIIVERTYSDGRPSTAIKEKMNITKAGKPCD